jgi:hypothetical protein
MRWPTPLLCVDLTQMRAARADPARILKHGTVGCGFETMTPKPSAVSTQRNKRRKPSALCKYERRHLCGESLTTLQGYCALPNMDGLWDIHHVSPQVR